jgi:hypothetical protein
MSEIRILRLPYLINELNRKSLHIKKPICNINNAIDESILNCIIDDRFLPILHLDNNKDKTSVIKGNYIIDSICRNIYSDDTKYYYDIINKKIVFESKDIPTIIPLYIFTSSILVSQYRRKHLKHIDEHDKCFDVIDKIGVTIFNFKMVFIKDSSEYEINQINELDEFIQKTDIIGNNI